MVCDVKIVYQDLNSENSQDYAQKLNTNEYGFRCSMYCFDREIFVLLATVPRICAANLSRIFDPFFYKKGS
jgi:hypothetical protein